jgi:hypothetical protein
MRARAFLRETKLATQVESCCQHRCSFRWFTSSPYFSFIEHWHFTVKFFPERDKGSDGSLPFGVFGVIMVVVRGQ